MSPGEGGTGRLPGLWITESLTAAHRWTITWHVLRLNHGEEDMIHKRLPAR